MVLTLRREGLEVGRGCLASTVLTRGRSSELWSREGLGKEDSGVVCAPRFSLMFPRRGGCSLGLNTAP